jgi:hypothetical protein
VSWLVSGNWLDACRRGELAALLNLYDERATLECDCERFSLALELAVSRGWLELHESGTFVKLTQHGAAHFA